MRHETSRPCPNAAFIKKHLQDNAAFEGNLEVDDRVCFSCYKSHLIILQNEKQNSYDSDLRSLLENISRKITATNSPSTLLQVRELALDKTHFKGYLCVSDVVKQHSDWLEEIRQSMWVRISFEDEMIPSTEALWRHWKRSCWVIDMWSQADQNTMTVASLTDFGWSITHDSILTVDWDSSENQEAIKGRVLLFTKGCKCKTGCATGRCACKKKGHNCTEGCSCLNCLNLPNATMDTRECTTNIEDRTIEWSSDSDQSDDEESDIEQVHG